MTWFADLSPCSYFGDVCAPVLRSVGWLEKEQNFVTATREPHVYVALKGFCVDPWQPVVTPGVHECSLCEYEPEMRGTRNLFIPGSGFLYVCPELTLHYMNAHGYGPPEEFCGAVLNCPPMRSIEYMKSVLANGGRQLMTAYT